MGGNRKKSKRKREGTSLANDNPAKKSALESEEEMMLDDEEETYEAQSSGSNLMKILNMACETANSTEENLCYLASLANLATDEKASNELIKLKIGDKLGSHLVNKNLKIQEKVAGIFRNVSTSGGLDACLQFIKDGIVAQAGIAVKEDVKQMHNFLRNTDIENLKQISCCLKQQITLIWNLCEASDIAINKFNEENVIHSLIEVFHAIQNDPELLLTIVQCLCTVTEENEAAIRVLINSKPCLEQLVQLLYCFDTSMKDLLIASNVSGVLLNMHGKLEESHRSVIMDKTLKIVDYAIDKCCIKSLKDVVLDHDQTKIDECLDLLSAKQLCLELLANLLCCEDDIEMMETSDEDNDDSYFECDHINENGTNFMEEVNKFQLHLKEFISNSGIVEKVHNCITYLELPEMQSLQENSETELLHKALIRVQKSALVCMSNILDMNDISDATFLSMLWSTMTRLASDKNAVFHSWLELSGCLRALAIAMAGNNSHEFLMNDSIEILEKWFTSSKEEPAKCNLLKIFGVAGKFFSQKEDGKMYLQKIAAILKRELLPSNSLVMIAETLDTTFDAFGEDGLCDEVLVSSGLANQLCQLPAVLKSKLKSQSHATKSFKSLIHTARINLNRFISYKKLKT